VTYQLASELAAQRVTIVSGLALGIDAEAHRGALDVGGRTVAVLGCGLDTIYPPEHRKLAAEIVQQGALISSFPLGTPPEAHNFPPRNRIISGLSLGVVVTEAGDKSGALLTAECAAEQGRDVFAVPGNITAQGSTGTNRLIQDGAHPVLGAQDVLDELELARVTDYVEARQSLPSVNDVERILLEHLSGEPLHVDEICRSAGMPVAQVSSTLAMLEIKGMVRRVGAMTYTRT
jgi:DNA processing protein